jgi:hypothetical protein
MMRGQRANEHIAHRSIRLSKQVGNAARILCVRLRDGLAAYRRRNAAAVLYTQLARLSDAELERRGIAHGDLHRLVSEMSET